MENWTAFVAQHSQHAHWYIFGASLLAGLNIPVSIDLLMILSATLAAAVIPQNALKLFFAIFLGCLFSAWLSFWLGRLLGPKLIKWPFFAKIFSEERREKMRLFYERRGLIALIIGRFIPFGVRNCLFMTSGMSLASFKQFALRDAIACGVWSCSCFFVYYFLGKNIEVLYKHIQILNGLIFLAFAGGVGGVILYKKKKKAK